MTYTVNERGIITSPGKFEGEPIFVPHFWDNIEWADNIEYEDDDSPIYRFVLTNDDIEDYPSFGRDALVLVLWESNQGFVYHSIERGAR